ncbi:low molecular weight protein-tyrosine-phosphatase [Uliginosibacterium sp. TH139]|uniref:low molecular weight protein-tyrosine-phosphatase n=1 Tax=Uliginosibacterium sp. TH139 TaxID=2067453 RepID=UPI000C7A0494|nr:low molecular weight protein-tyrosine-phosphatase [Uliginosibacterium sp. TH139]PLK49973.1 phosphotyrosine protein phosphatase [Uliginosibacterium sp. TH139]
MKRILFVCTGNICRSPTADGIARHLAAEQGLAKRFEFDSAGTHAYHAGEAPDPRAQNAARKRGYELADLRARPVVAEDFEHFDLILAMDKGHYVWLKRECPRHLHERIQMFLDYSATYPGHDVPDPYYGGPDGFEQVLDLCEEVIRELLSRNA